MFALFEDDFPSFMRPQASLTSAAQPAVMDIRPLRGRSLASRHRKEKRIVSIVFKTSASKDQASPNDRFGVKHFL